MLKLVLIISLILCTYYLPGVFFIISGRYLSRSYAGLSRGNYRFLLHWIVLEVSLRCLQSRTDLGWSVLPYFWILLSVCCNPFRFLFVRGTNLFSCFDILHQLLLYLVTNIVGSLFGYLLLNITYVLLYHSLVTKIYW